MALVAPKQASEGDGGGVSRLRYFASSVPYVSTTSERSSELIEAATQFCRDNDVANPEEFGCLAAIFLTWTHETDRRESGESVAN